MATKNEHSTINGDYDNNDGYINDHAQHRIVSMVTAWGRATTATYHYYYLHIYGWAVSLYIPLIMPIIRDMEIRFAWSVKMLPSQEAQVSIWAQKCSNGNSNKHIYLLVARGYSIPIEYCLVDSMSSRRVETRLMAHGSRSTNDCWGRTQQTIDKLYRRIEWDKLWCGQEGRGRGHPCTWWGAWRWMKPPARRHHRPIAHTAVATACADPENNRQDTNKTFSLVRS